MVLCDLTCGPNGDPLLWYCVTSRMDLMEPSLMVLRDLTCGPNEDPLMVLCDLTCGPNGALCYGTV